MSVTDPGTLRYLELEGTYAAHNYQSLDVVIERAAGVWVWDVEGKKYLDLLPYMGRSIRATTTPASSRPWLSKPRRSR